MNENEERTSLKKINDDDDDDDGDDGDDDDDASDGDGGDGGGTAASAKVWTNKQKKTKKDGEKKEWMRERKKDNKQ